jgi:hypothetical protein
MPIQLQSAQPLGKAQRNKHGPDRRVMRLTSTDSAEGIGVFFEKMSPQFEGTARS